MNRRAAPPLQLPPATLAKRPSAPTTLSSTITRRSLDGRQGVERDAKLLGQRGGQVSGHHQAARPPALGQVPLSQVRWVSKAGRWVGLQSSSGPDRVLPRNASGLAAAAPTSSNTLSKPNTHPPLRCPLTCTSTTAYSSASFTATARLAGMVQGVVVQMPKWAPCSAACAPSGTFSPATWRRAGRGPGEHVWVGRGCVRGGKHPGALHGLSPAGDQQPAARPPIRPPTLPPLTQLLQRHGHVDGAGGVALRVLQLSLSQGGARGGAPVHRLATAAQQGGGIRAVAGGQARLLRVSRLQAEVQVQQCQRPPIHSRH